MQAQCVTHARQLGLLVVGSAAGGWYRNGAATANAMKAIGVSPGAPDLLVLCASPGANGLALELKIGKNEMSKQQEEWFAKARSVGWRCEVVRGDTPDDGFQEFVRILSEHMAVASHPGATVPHEPLSIDVDIEIGGCSEKPLVIL